MSEKENKRKTKIGFIGVGGMGQSAHLRSYVTIPECEVVAVADLKFEQARQVAIRYGISNAYPSYEELLKNEVVDALVVSQTFWYHGSILPKVLQAGLPIFVEKPLASSIPAGEKIIAEMEKANTWIMVGNHKRCEMAVTYGKKLIEDYKKKGNLGALKYVRMEMPPGDWRVNGFREHIRVDDSTISDLTKDAPDSDFSAEENEKYIYLINFYIHQINLIRYFLGESYRVTYADPSGVLLIGESKSGVPCSLEMDTYRSTIAWNEKAFISFEKGFIEMGLPAPLAKNRPGWIRYFEDPDDSETSPMVMTPDLPWEDAMRQQALQFIRAVRGEIEPPCSAYEALEDLKNAKEYLNLLLKK
ncbi:MAG: Gfo/Idh/MocA family oxidoreductase [Opitutaceae bacterium]|nr:Gfo/Idh/MocA family oxidoreductase [Opitutaceae bacterium]